jgi:hypothetical protein
MTMLWPELPPDARLTDPILAPRNPPQTQQVSFMKRRPQELPTSGAPMTALDTPSIDWYIAENILRSAAMNGGCESPAQEIAVDAIEMRNLQKYAIFLISIIRPFRGKWSKREATDQMDDGHFDPTAFVYSM